MPAELCSTGEQTALLISIVLANARLQASRGGVAPLLLPLVALLSLVVLVISYLTLGHDRAVELVIAGFERLARWRPEMAAQLRQRAERWADRLDRVANRLPARWRDGLNLNGFGRKQQDLPAKMRQDPFERLARDLEDR